MVYSIYWGVCGTPEIKDWRDDGKIDFYQFHFLFPEGKVKALARSCDKIFEIFVLMNSNIFIHFITGTHRSEMEVYGTNEVKQFCKVILLKIND